MQLTFVGGAVCGFRTLHCTGGRDEEFAVMPCATSTSKKNCLAAAVFVYFRSASMVIALFGRSLEYI
jgi:hypothetical protein